MKLISTAVFFAIVQVAVALDYHWRVYANGGCDHSSPANQTFPPNPNAPEAGFNGACTNTPIGIKWNALEINNKNLDVFVFCSQDCKGTSTLNAGTFCNFPNPGCTIASFETFPL
ncbi:hypothetical protein C8J57DRAFT_286965 [Mycena rebaudengoi]|nr:hypothetical protein C8J57DRAFT_1729928 [Mycena rebaudengoi]KAJ7271722.1 hypothetical protein C8J57DRAFT_286965 [Mycena rebaudengoi]